MPKPSEPSHTSLLPWHTVTQHPSGGAASGHPFLRSQPEILSSSSEDGGLLSTGHPCSGGRGGRDKKRAGEEAVF